MILRSARGDTSVIPNNADVVSALQAGCGRCFNPNGRSTTDEFDVVRCPVGENTVSYFFHT